MRVLSILLLFLSTASSSFADAWSHFYPEFVTKYGCRVEEVNSLLNGSSNQRIDYFGAYGWATRKGVESVGSTEQWEQEIGQYPPDRKSVV